MFYVCEHRPTMFRSRSSRRSAMFGRHVHEDRCRDSPFPVRSTTQSGSEVSLSGKEGSSEEWSRAEGSTSNDKKTPAGVIMITALRRERGRAVDEPRRAEAEARRAPEFERRDEDRSERGDHPVLRGSYGSRGIVGNRNPRTALSRPTSCLSEQRSPAVSLSLRSTSAVRLPSLARGPTNVFQLFVHSPPWRRTADWPKITDPSVNNLRVTFSTPLFWRLPNARMKIDHCSSNGYHWM